MVLFKKVVPRLLLLFAICFAVTPAAFAPAQAQNTDTNLKQDSQQPGVGQSRSPGRTGQSDLEEAIPIDAEKIDEAGKTLGKKIDAVTVGASVKYGRWINARAFGDVSWLKLVFCLGLILLVFAIERVIRSFISLRIAKATQGPVCGWGDLILQALSRPLTIFIQVYGNLLGFVSYLDLLRRTGRSKPFSQGGRQGSRPRRHDSAFLVSLQVYLFH